VLRLRRHDSSHHNHQLQVGHDEWIKMNLKHLRPSIPPSTQSRPTASGSHDETPTPTSTAPTPSAASDVQAGASSPTFATNSANPWRPTSQ
jgi:hypothetical protein